MTRKLIYYRTLLVLAAGSAVFNASGIVKALFYGRYGSIVFGVAGLVILAATYRFGLRPGLQSETDALRERNAAATAKRIAELEKELGIG